MQSLCLKDLPKAFKEMLNLIKDETIQKLYSKFKFIYLESKLNNKENVSTDKNVEFETISEKQILCYLSLHKFITYFISFANETKNVNKKTNEIDGNIILSNIKSNNFLIFCVESECLIINQIDTSKINAFIQKLKKNSISIINLNEDCQIKKDDEEADEITEVNSFCSFPRISKEINKNPFVQITIRPIAGFMIRRYFYPTKYFNDPTFFFFDKADISRKEIFLKNEIAKSLLCKKLDDLVNKINSSKINQVKHAVFNEDDFIILRTIYVSYQAIYYFVIHLKTLFVFMMKKLNNPNDSIKDNSNEISFCENYSHRCLVPFYGFIKKKEKTIGMIYEYMCNGSLKSYVKSQENQMSDLFILTSIIRIFEGVDYLHSNSLIHRDIKPSNILLDHDNIPYISDFPTIRPIIKEEKKTSEYTLDLGSLPYMSPEQYQGNSELISYPTDIYSFGVMIYFICERKEINSDFNYIIKENIIPSLNKTTINLQDIFEMCVKYDPSERITDKNLLRMIINKANSFFLETNSNVFNHLDEILQFILEIFIIKRNYSKETNIITQNIINSQSIISNKFKNDLEKKIYNTNWSFWFCIGMYHYKNKNSSYNIKKAIHYLTLSANQNNSIAQFILGNLYYFNEGLPHDINKSIYFLTLLANQNNSYAQFMLGTIYYNERYESHNINKSIYYLTLSANQNDPNAQCMLGKIYFKSKYVSSDIKKSIHYLTLSANQNNPEAIFLLGYIYYTDEYVPHDINKSIYYLTLSANHNNSNAQFILGNLYYLGIFETRDIIRSIHYLSISANLNNQYAQFMLGKIYYEGNYVSRDIKKSINYLSLSAFQNNSSAQLMLSEIYYEGKYVLRDINKSIHYLTLSANSNDPIAQLMLGVIFYEDKYVSRDIKKSIHYLTQSASQNQSFAQFLLSNIYMEDKSVQNITKSIKYLQNSAYNKCREAQLILADLLFEGIHLKHEIEKIIHLYKEASCFNNQYAKNNLGVIYKNGISGINKNLSLAKEYFKEAVAQKNDAVSMFNLSNLLLNEEQETKDYKKVIELLIGSSRQGLMISLQLLAFILIEKHKSIYYNTIINELNAYGQQSDDLVINLFQMCKIFLHENKESFQKMFQNIRKTDLIYIKHKIYTLNEVEKARYSHVQSQKSNLKDIDEYFYEGFEFPI
ncbi:hypothetical protein M9Y10_007141 [Tritrichomonas musculus]|uniref:Protein kinase domain-containing protein n=1 Tax=Tritrichomonas musculus TaxID=1915356 RepID=A0ABR2J0J5_9EUKA